jgi:serine/threonine-protein kinase
VNGGADSEVQLLAGRYRLGARIGAGGMGAVHRATDTRLAREVAVKVLPAEALGDQAARQRLIREALACAALQHPGIVHVYDVGETEDGGAYLVMELVSGTSLR